MKASKGMKKRTQKQNEQLRESTKTEETNTTIY